MMNDTMTYRQVFVAAMLSIFAGTAMADTVTGRLLDAAGKPLAGVELSGLTVAKDAKGGMQLYTLEAKTGGSTILSVRKRSCTHRATTETSGSPASWRTVTS